MISTSLSLSNIVVVLICIAITIGRGRKGDGDHTREEQSQMNADRPLKTERTVHTPLFKVDLADGPRGSSWVARITRGDHATNADNVCNLPRRVVVTFSIVDTLLPSFRPAS